jgi:hypothetical protein
VTRRVVVLFVLLTVVLTACKVDTRVNVRVDGDGSGDVRVRVIVDAEAVRAAEVGGATLESRVRLDDLPAAGWQVVPWHRRPDGSAVLELRHPFDSPKQLHTVMTQLNGARGPLRQVRLSKTTDPVRTTFQFRALADLAGVDAGVITDPQLAANLSAQRVDVAGLDAALTGKVRDALSMRVAVALPAAASKSWVLPPHSKQMLETSSTRFDPGRAVWLGLGILLAVATLALVFVGEYRARKRRKIAEPIA